MMEKGWQSTAMFNSMAMNEIVAGRMEETIKYWKLGIEHARKEVEQKRRATQMWNGERWVRKNAACLLDEVEKELERRRRNGENVTEEEEDMLEVEEEEMVEAAAGEVKARREGGKEVERKRKRGGEQVSE
mmetsp:Transcript_35783/g.93277  ORF Transcript_35783/g.93277 Transcript_35783/m.93277 type:complete len:131 (+) Transcript_35783:87-479(+)